MKRFGTSLQRHWDWRAAGNFVLGGTGGGLLFFAAAASALGAVPVALALAGLALVGAGLTLVWLEIGRPWRALNVFRHAETSWMTREAFVAALTFVLALAAVVSGSAALFALAGVSGLAFLYCQGRILKASKGIAAWRAPLIVPLVVATGLVEGAALTSLSAPSRPAWLPIALLALVVVRGLVWLAYKAKLDRNGLPATTRSALAKANAVLLVAGTLIPAGLLAWVVAVPNAALAGLAAALLALAAGWYLKYKLVTGASQVQGYAFGALKRGHPLAQQS